MRPLRRIGAMIASALAAIIAPIVAPVLPAGLVAIAAASPAIAAPVAAVTPARPSAPAVLVRFSEGWRDLVAIRRRRDFKTTWPSARASPA